jgi:hypothetical protein
MTLKMEVAGFTELLVTTYKIVFVVVVIVFALYSLCVVCLLAFV